MNNFQELNLNEEIISAITELGFVKPTPIQELVITANNMFSYSIKTNRIIVISNK